MATDYDTLRRDDLDEPAEESLEHLTATRRARAATVMFDETDEDEGPEPPDADLTGQELTVRVLPRQADEFTCSRCFIISHRTRLADHDNGRPICQDCA